MELKKNVKFTMKDIISKEFMLFMRESIKELENEQRIAKRDRKDEKHPCPDQRKYLSWQADRKVHENRQFLRSIYETYYFMKHNKDYDWLTVNFELKEKNRWWYGAPEGTKIEATIIEKTNSLRQNWKVLNTSDCYIHFNVLEDIIKKYCGYVGK